ncbi:MAG TPA: glycosyltransferase family 2 protein [Smithella sp.]|nr:glycosyltransferase family 2 protein [Prolixibacteraceae bacterium]MBP9014718.1 glycosyltransferase family 2 protein [Smithella sp.]MDM7985958.1 glycosyltransferase family 2 protein [Smithella sp.]HNY51066.1 glycosyltransferase family 2 protein [Smithella sp.]HOG91172.1 glycosyltransferase family 2 protein [Smithella sp.]
MDIDQLNQNIDVSIIVAVYFNAKSLEILFNRIKQNVIGKNPDRTFEIIFIDDGSKDKSLEVLLNLQRAYPEYIKIIKFTRNFGQVPAITAGLRKAQGKLIISIDADLQDPPELMNEMIVAHFAEGFEIAIGIRQERKESLYRRAGSSIWYKILRKLTFPEFPEKGFNYWGISAKVKDRVLMDISNGTQLSNVLIVWTGFPIKNLPYTRQNRMHGKSKFGLLKKIQAMFDSLVSFSFFPIRAMTVLGFIISFFGFAYAALIFFSKLLGHPFPYKGWVPMMILILVLSGFQMLMIGIMGEYLWRTLDIARKRSTYVIEKIFE